MKNLTNKIKNRVIVFFGKGHKLITQAEEEFFLRASNGNAIGTTLSDGAYINFSSVAKIIGVDDFYNEHPELRPHRPEMMDIFKRDRIDIRKFDKYDTNALELMREGVSNHISGNEWRETGKRPAQEILEKMDKRISELKERSFKTT